MKFSKLVAVIGSALSHLPVVGSVFTPLTVPQANRPEKPWDNSWFDKQFIGKLPKRFRYGREAQMGCPKTSGAKLARRLESSSILHLTVLDRGTIMTITPERFSEWYQRRNPLAMS